GAIFFHCASVSNGPDRAIGPPSALLTLLIPHFTKLNHSHFRGLSWVMQQLLGIAFLVYSKISGAAFRNGLPPWLQLQRPALASQRGFVGVGGRRHLHADKSFVTAYDECAFRGFQQSPRVGHLNFAFVQC